MRMLNEDELRDATLLVFANKQVSYKNHNTCVLKKCGKVITINRNVIGMVVQEEYLLIKFVVASQIVSNIQYMSKYVFPPLVGSKKLYLFTLN